MFQVASMIAIYLVLLGVSQIYGCQWSFFIYILNRIHQLHVLLCNLMFLVMLYNNFLFV